MWCVCWQIWLIVGIRLRPAQNGAKHNLYFTKDRMIPPGFWLEKFKKRLLPFLWPWTHQDLQVQFPSLQLDWNGLVCSKEIVPETWIIHLTWIDYESFSRESFQDKDFLEHFCHFAVWLHRTQVLIHPSDSLALLSARVTWALSIGERALVSCRGQFASAWIYERSTTMIARMRGLKKL